MFDDLSKAFVTQRMMAQRNLRRSLDPFGDEDYGLTKLRHVFKDGQRVRVVKPGHHAHNQEGVVERATDGGIEVKLDSGHSLMALDSELIPADFPTGSHNREELTAVNLKVVKVFSDPLPIPADGEVADEPMTKAVFAKESREYANRIIGLIAEGKTPIFDRALRKQFEDLGHGQLLKDAARAGLVALDRAA